MNTRSVSVSVPVSAEAVAASPGLRRSWTAFWFTPVDPIGLHVVRLLAGLLFLAWLLPFAGHLNEFFSLEGWFDRQAYREASRLPDGAPIPIGWSLLYLCGSATALKAFYAVGLIVTALFTLGVWTRVTAVLTWLVVASFQASPAFGYGADALIGLLSFYLMVGYVLLGQWSEKPSRRQRLLGSWDTFLLGRRKDAEEQPRSFAANLTLRLIQVHFALVLVVSGLHKLQFGDWWAGVAFWYPLHSPFETTPESVRAAAGNAVSTLFFLSLAQYVMLAWQIGFPLFAFRKRWRAVLLIGAAIGWIGSTFLYREPLYGPVLFIACLSFVTSGEWRALGRLLGRRERKISPPHRLRTMTETTGSVAIRS